MHNLIFSLLLLFFSLIAFISAQSTIWPPPQTLTLGDPFPSYVSPAALKAVLCAPCASSAVLTEALPRFLGAGGLLFPFPADW
ncbi:MAG: hypothetical protein Q8P67_04940, partial [archaeon]|nr:hypothetical protein [archaeon]